MPRLVSGSSASRVHACLLSSYQETAQNIAAARKRFQRPCLSTGFTKGHFIKGLSSKYEPYNGSPTYQIFGKNFHKMLIFLPKVRNGELPLGSLSNTTLQNLSTRGGRVLPDSVTCFSANKMSIKGCPQKLIAPGRPHLG